MNARELSQWLSLSIGIFIVTVAAFGMYLRPDKKWTLLGWMGYGLINAVFYIIVLGLDMGQLGNDISPLRTLIKDTLVASLIFFASLDDFKAWWKHDKSN